MGQYKVCSVCLEERPKDWFTVKQMYKTKSGLKPSYNYFCKNCASKVKASYNKEAPWKWICYRFKVTEDFAKELWILTQQSCNICGISWDGTSEKLCIDHDHTTGRIRGILCKHCNHVLGHSRDSIEVLTKAINYLKGE